MLITLAYFDRLKNEMRFSLQKSNRGKHLGTCRR